MMNKFNSTIKIKTCKCGCGNHKKLGLNGFASIKCMPEEMQGDDKYKKSNVTHRNKQNLNKLTNKVVKAAKEQNAFKSPQLPLKLLLAKADSLFSHFVRDRDTDKNGIITCYCCGKKGLKTDRVDKEDQKSDFMFNCGHFVSRVVYSLRFDELNCRTICNYCNLEMQMISKGKAYQQFRTKLVIELGEEKVQWMGNQKYVINKLTHSYLEEIIKKYATRKS